ncbi:MAG TPA: FAD-dependent oxidoreductase [Planctomycetota bacterium]|nr:FAD-dependent oxidoreductase [Planctomycetota bacterium]
MSTSLYARLHRRYGRAADGPTRRDVLQATLAGAAGLLISRLGLGQDSRPATRPSAKRTVVIGAGFAGLAAAHELSAAGYDVTVVEARNRVGGRVLTFLDFVQGRVVEGGGELIGSNHPTWVAYADKFGLELLETTEDEEAAYPIVLDGRRLSDEESAKLWEEMDATLALMNDDARAVDADRPWTSPGAAALDARSVYSWIEAREASRLCKSALHALVASDNGVSTAWQSYLGQLAQVKGGGVETYWTDSETHRCKGGNQQLAARLAATLPKERLHLGAPARHVSIGEAACAVVLADGRRFECDDVVLAAPPSTWRKIDFHTSRDGGAAIPGGLAPQMGVNLKVLFAVKGRFWEATKTSPYALSDGPLSQTWEGTDNQSGDGPATLHAFSGGAAAEAARAWKPEERIEQSQVELERLYPGARKHVTGARFMDWPGEPWTQAGYSFPAPGQVTAMGPLLAEGVAGKLHFAGEHANPAFVGYMEGALGSGVAVARRLARRDGLLK